jgi:hypothetical protein
MENNPLSNVRDVMRLIPGSDERFQCTVDLTLNGVTETVGYVAVKDDVAETGQWVYEQIISGAAGDISEYIPPAPPSNEQLAEMVRATRGHLLQRLDSFVSNPLRWSTLEPELQAEVAVFRQALLDVPQQPGFPSNITWPEPPAYLGIQLLG